MRACCLLLLLATACAPTQKPAPNPEGPVLITATDEFSEGPVFDAAGNLFFTHGRFVSKIAAGDLGPGAEPEIWVETEGANGHKVLPSGDHLLCVPGERIVLRLSPSGERLGAASAECDGEPLRAPNDITLSPEGGFYFTDPGGSREAPIGTVHYVDPDGVTHLAAGGLRVPNGLVLSPDGSRLYVAETVPNRILAFPVEAPGRLGPLEIFAELPSKEGVQAEPDGLAVDPAGRLYVAHLGMSAVQVLRPDGELLRSLPGGNYDVSNLTFSPDGRRLYVTGSIGHRSNTPGRLWRLDVARP